MDRRAFTNTPSNRNPPSPVTELKNLFRSPPPRFGIRPLWFWNNTEVTREGIRDQLEKAKDIAGYAGLSIVPFGERFSPEYLSDDYFLMYGEALERSRELGLSMWLYDEYGFPSGSGGAIHGDNTPRFAKQFPDQTIKRLDKIEAEIEGPCDVTLQLPEGILMSVVAMNQQKEITNLRGYISADSLNWKAPGGSWKVMFFTCVTDGDPNVDYLDAYAVRCFLQLAHQQYYDRFSEYFGDTIVGIFYDEPTLYRADGRMWTPALNEQFVTAKGFDPEPLYPSLWYDIGEDTEAARNALFGFRAELYAQTFAGEIHKWADAHGGLPATGHQDQEELVNPVAASADLMLCFKHQDIPGIDKIGGDRPAEKFCKVVSSAANNWDKTLVMSETYGLMGDLDWDDLSRVALDQFTKGINLFIPHAVWYDDTAVDYPPNLSWAHGKYRDGLRSFNEFLSRLSVMMQQPGRHVADVAMLYPISMLQGAHKFDGGLTPYEGGTAIPEADYIDIAEILSDVLCTDFTYLHPEILDERCSIEGQMLRLNNEVNAEEFRLLIVPRSDTIRWSNLRRIVEFLESGGSVVFTGALPTKSAEFGCDSDVVRVMAELFPDGVSEGGGAVYGQTGSGGWVSFAPVADAAYLRSALDERVRLADVAFDHGRELRYIHKVCDGVHVYLFANIGHQRVESRVRLRGERGLEWWDPYSGETRRAEVALSEGVTTVEVTLDPARCVVLVGRD